jgi:hypothetical protein
VARKPEPPKPTTWTIYKIAAKMTWVGTVEAIDEAAATQRWDRPSRLRHSD